MSNARYSMNTHIAAARRQAQASEELLAKLKPHLNPVPGTAYAPPPDIYVVGLASDDPVECSNCGHSSVHGRYGCEYERGDAWVTGNQPEAPTILMAQGPCGCKEFEPVDHTAEHEEIERENRIRDARQKAQNDEETP